MLAPIDELVRRLRSTGERTSALRASISTVGPPSPIGPASPSPPTLPSGGIAGGPGPVGGSGEGL